MGIVKFQSKYSLIYFSIGVGLGYLNMGFLGPLLLSKDQLGELNFVISTSVLIAAIAKFGIPSALIRFYPIYSKKGRSKELMNSISLLSIATLFLCLIALFVIPYFSTSDFSSKFLSNFGYITMISLAFMAFKNVFSYASSLHKPLSGVFLREVLLRLLILSYLILFYFEIIGFQGYMTAVAIAYLVILLILFFQFGKLSLSFKPLLLKKELKEMMNYSLFATLSNSSGILVSSLDKIMIATMLSYQATAIYSVAFMVGTVVTMPQRIIGTPITPLMSKLMAHEDYKEVRELSVKSSTMLSILTTFLLMIILNSLDYFFDLLPEGYEDGFTVVLLIGFANLMTNIALPLVHIISNSKLYRFDFVTNAILVVLIIATNYAGIHYYGMNGAAAATLISMFVYHSIRGIIVYKNYKLNLVTKKLMISIGLGIILFILCHYLFESLDYYWYFFLSNGFLTISYGLCIYFLKISPDFNTAIDTYTKKLFK